jgi:hypothetical protein
MISTYKQAKQEIDLMFSTSLKFKEYEQVFEIIENEYVTIRFELTNDDYVKLFDYVQHNIIRLSKSCGFNFTTTELGEEFDSFIVSYGMQVKSTMSFEYPEINVVNGDTMNATETMIHDIEGARSMEERFNEQM